MVGCHLNYFICKVQKVKEKVIRTTESAVTGAPSTSLWCWNNCKIFLVFLVKLLHESGQPLSSWTKRHDIITRKQQEQQYLSTNSAMSEELTTSISMQFTHKNTRTQWRRCPVATWLWNDNKLLNKGTAVQIHPNPFTKHLYSPTWIENRPTACQLTHPWRQWCSCWGMLEGSLSAGWWL